MATRKIATSTLWQLGSQIAMAGMSILTVKFVTISLERELVGLYNSAYGYLQLFGILADFGLYAVAVREVSKADRKEEVLGALIVIRIGILILSLLSALLFVWLLPHWSGTTFPLAVTIAALVPFFTLLAGILRTIFQVEYRMHWVFVAEVVQRIITVTAIGSFAILGMRGSTDVFYCYLFLAFGGLGACVLFLISLVAGHRYIAIRPCFKTKRLKPLLRSAAPFGLAFLCLALYRQFDITMIALLRPDFELQNAYYGIIVRMADMAFLIPTFLLNSTLPVLSERHEKGEDTRSLLGKTIFILLLLGSVEALFALIWAKPLVLLLTTPAYLSSKMQLGSDAALAMMALPFFLNGLIQYGFYVLLTAHKWKRLVLTLLPAAALSLVSNYILIPVYGFLGAGLTMIAVHILLALTLFPQGLRALPVRLSLCQLLQWTGFSATVAGGLLLSASSLHSELHTLIMGILMGFLIVGVVFALRIHIYFR